VSTGRALRARHRRSEGSRLLRARILHRALGRVFSAEPVATDGDGNRKAEHHRIALFAVGTWRVQRGDQFPGEQAHAIELSAVREHGPEARFAACGEDAPYTGYFRAAHVSALEDRRGERDSGWHRCKEQRRQVFGRDGHHRVHLPGDARFHFIGNADPQVGDAQRLCDLFANEAAKRAVLRVGAAHELAEDPAEGHRQIECGGTGRGQRRQVGDRAGHPLPVAHALGRHTLGHLRNARAMGEHVAHGRLSLASRAVFRPVAGDGGVVVELPTVDQHVHRGRRHRFGNGIDVEQRVAIHSTARGRVGYTSPGVHHQPAAVISGDLYADLAAGSDCRLDGLLHSGVGRQSFGRGQGILRIRVTGRRVVHRDSLVYIIELCSHS
jgi:hypothetical protein